MLYIELYRARCIRGINSCVSSYMQYSRLILYGDVEKGAIVFFCSGRREVGECFLEDVEMFYCGGGGFQQFYFLVFLFIVVKVMFSEVFVMVV